MMKIAQQALRPAAIAASEMVSSGAAATAGGVSQQLGSHGQLGGLGRRPISICSQPTVTQERPRPGEGPQAQVTDAGHVWLKTTPAEQAMGAPANLSAEPVGRSRLSDTIRFQGQFPDGASFNAAGSMKQLQDPAQPYDTKGNPVRETDLGPLTPAGAQALAQYRQELMGGDTNYFVGGAPVQPGTVNCVDATHEALKRTGFLDAHDPSPPLGTRPQDLHDQVDVKHQERLTGQGGETS